MEVDGGLEVLLVAKATSGVLDPLDLGVERLAGGVGHSVPDVGDDVLEPEEARVERRPRR